MCLTKVTKRFKPNDDMVVGYKVYEMRWGHPHTPYQRMRQDIGKHYISNGGELGFGLNNYENGFHLYTDIEYVMHKANRFGYSVYELHAWDITAKGYEANQHVVVAKNIRPIRRIKI